ncbi:MAG: Proline--tRNA ligase [Pelotomaculum sp. PtaU1.Bin035]|nr:MAG: Proline--tRNA ligase [Pelotomaculum sp. PtaU1.Bin035]
MRTTELFAPTLREVPAEAEVISHQLLLRAGFIRRDAAGIYTYLPLAIRVLKKISQIIREEMDRQGGQELLMPIIQPAELWQESGRWDVYGPELFRLRDRHDREFALGPTHEEIITALVRGEVNSYKQLPLLLYQIQNKYRDERRPRFGLLRGREFIMKDLYSFDRDNEGLQVSYMKMHEAYTRVFRRCGLRFRPVEADSGAIGGSDTHEFMVLADSGEASVLFCENGECEYAANVEKAAPACATADSGEDQKPLGEVLTPGSHTVEEVAEFLRMPPHKIIKTLLYETEKEVVAALVRGDRDVNEIKLSNALTCLRLKLAGPDTVRDVTGAMVGFAGPVNLKGVKIVADPEVAAMVNAVCGANMDDTHLTNVNPVRDFTTDIVCDIRMVRAGEPCPRCGGALLEAKGIEVGQIFKLGDKYSKVLGAFFRDESGQSRPVIMGCYGIGVTRTMAAAIEQNNDKDGIIWPAAIAPYHAVVVPVSTKDESQMAMAEDVYGRLVGAGIEAMFDDRPERAGVKFKDADLIGYPLRITIGTKAITNNQVEIRVRRTGEVMIIPVDELDKYVMELLGRL